MSGDILEAQRHITLDQFSHSHHVGNMIPNHVGKLCEVPGDSIQRLRQAVRTGSSRNDGMVVVVNIVIITIIVLASILYCSYF